MPHISRLSHICLGATDLNKTKDFFCELLAGRIFFEFRNEKKDLYGYMIQLGDGAFLEVFKQQTIKNTDNLVRHLCFQTSDIYSLARYLEGHGYKPQITRGKKDNVLQFWIEGPDRLQIEFHQYDETLPDFYKGVVSP